MSDETSFNARQATTVRIAMVLLQPSRSTYRNKSVSPYSQSVSLSSSTGQQKLQQEPTRGRSPLQDLQRFTARKLRNCEQPSSASGVGAQKISNSNISAPTSQELRRRGESAAYDSYTQPEPGYQSSPRRVRGVYERRIYHALLS
jgi:hypothetical protein